MEKVFTVSLGSFCQVEKTDFGYRYEVDLESTKEINCIKDGDDMVDINTYDRYYLLKREACGTLAKDEYKTINLNVVYALNVHDYNLTNQKSKEALKVHLQAIKARYVINKAQKQLKKVK
jgi:hypothetical protein